MWIDTLASASNGTLLTSSVQMEPRSAEVGDKKEACSLLVIHLDNQSTMGSQTTKACPLWNSEIVHVPANLSSLIFTPQQHFPPFPSTSPLRRSEQWVRAVSDSACYLWTTDHGCLEILSASPLCECLPSWILPLSPITPQRFLHTFPPFLDYCSAGLYTWPFFHIEIHLWIVSSQAQMMTL